MAAYEYIDHNYDVLLSALVAQDCVQRWAWLNRV